MPLVPFFGGVPVGGAKRYLPVGVGELLVKADAESDAASYTKLPAAAVTLVNVLVVVW